MCGKQRFYICKKCGNLIGLIEDKGVPMQCCGEDMAELAANTAEASVEKHLPVITAAATAADDAASGEGIECISVQVGSVPHPMEDAHHISFIYIETERGGQRKCLRVGEAPKLTFRFSDDKPVAVYAYCNLHGMWKTDLTA